MNANLQKIILAAALAAATQAGAQGYPSKPVKVMVTSSPGGATDIQARLFSAKLGDSLKQGFVVDNRAGAGGRIAASFIAQQAPKDGYTVLATSPGFTIWPAVDAKPPADAIKDFEPIALASKAPYALVVHPKFAPQNMKEFLAYAKANPGKVNFGLSNVGSTTNFAQVWMEDAGGIKMAIIPYKGTGPATQDLIAGRLDVSFANVISAGPHIKAGRIRALAVTTAERSAGLPDLPTFQEAGLKDYEVTTWHGWLAPKGTPRAAITTLNAEMNKMLKLPEVVKVISEDGGMTVGGTPEVFARHIASEIERWKRLAKIGNIKSDAD
jgi:tripartite-type tricarboxylate transporter receptor subunit TctC